MTSVRNYLWQIQIVWHDLFDPWRRHNLPITRNLDIPYVSQCASPELINQSNPYDPATDSNWPVSGATSTEEYQFWIKHTCGMACLSMALQNEGQTIPPITLAKQCQQYGGYAADPTILDRQGLVYQPFCRFLHQEFGWESQVKAPMSVGDIEVALQSGRYVMASVHPGIATLSQSISDPGGHLILVIGFDRNRTTLTYHDPWGRTGRRQAVNITVDDFRLYFAQRGIIFNPPQG